MGGALHGGTLTGMDDKSTPMASDETDATGSGDVPPPDYFVPALRCGLEMALVGAVVALLGLPASSTLMTGVVLLATMLAMLVVFFYCLNQQMAEWIRRAQKRPTIRDDGEFL